WGLFRLRATFGRRQRALADADLGLCADAQSFSSRPLATQGRRSQPLDAMADDGPRPALSSTLPHERARLARSLQSDSYPTGRTPAQRAAVRRAQSSASENGQACRRMGLVEFVVAA